MSQFWPSGVIKDWRLTAWLGSLSSASGSCQNWICHKSPLKKSIPIRHIRSCDGARRSLSTHLISVVWHLPSVQPQFTASAYGIWEISRPKTCVRNSLVLKIRWIVFGVKGAFGQFIYCSKWRRRMFLTPVRMRHCTKEDVLFQRALKGRVRNIVLGIWQYDKNLWPWSTLCTLTWLWRIFSSVALPPLG